MRHEYSGKIEDRWPEPFALIDEVAGYMIAKQEGLADPYLKNVVMEDLINAVIDLRIDLVSRLADVAAYLPEGGCRGEGSSDAGAL